MTFATVSERSRGNAERNMARIRRAKTTGSSSGGSTAPPSCAASPSRAPGAEGDDGGAAVGTHAVSGEVAPEGGAAGVLQLRDVMAQLDAQLELLRDAFGDIGI